jgi:hypothetical protein
MQLTKPTPPTADALFVALKERYFGVTKPD